jgi:hypothetical protein
VAGWPYMQSSQGRLANLEEASVAVLSYSLRFILLFINMDVSITKICLDTFILAKSIMGRRE